MQLNNHLVREALQARLLVELMANSVHRELVLKGGLAMRAVHGSVRHTKDIDLDADSKHSRQRIHGVVVASIRSALRANLIERPQVTEPKQTDTTMRWKIGGVVPGSNVPMNLTIEVSRRPSLTEGHIIEVPLSKDFSAKHEGTMVRVLDSQALAVTKVLALTDPRRMAPRDLHDLNVLIEANVEPPIDLLASLPTERLQLALTELWSKVESMDYPLFRNEVLSVMPAAMAAAVTEERFEELRLNVGTKVQKWVEEALERQRTTGVSPSLGGSLLDGAVAPPPPAAAQTPTRKPSL
jgi:predicted nucleotidyltransferase component of viral defense system